MSKALAAIGLRGKSGARAEEHDEDEEAKAAEEHEDEKEAEAKAKAQEEEDDKEAKAEEHEDDKEAKAVALAAKAMSSNARAITDLCALAGKPELAGEYIASGKSQAVVRRELLGARADASDVGEIAGQTGPNGSPAATDAMWNHAIEKNAKAFGFGK